MGFIGFFVKLIFIVSSREEEEEERVCVCVCVFRVREVGEKTKLSLSLTIFYFIFFSPLVEQKPKYTAHQPDHRRRVRCQVGLMR